jgi:DNA-binding PadR family transcriptional regulator
MTHHDMIRSQATLQFHAAHHFGLVLLPDHSIDDPNLIELVANGFLRVSQEQSGPTTVAFRLTPKAHRWLKARKSL